MVQGDTFTSIPISGPPLISVTRPYPSTRTPTEQLSHIAQGLLQFPTRWAFLFGGSMLGGLCLGRWSDVFGRRPCP